MKSDNRKPGRFTEKKGLTKSLVTDGSRRRNHSIEVEEPLRSSSTEVWYRVSLIKEELEKP